MKLRDIMQRFPQSVRPEDTLVAARDIMLWGEFRHLTVLDEGRLVGVLSDHDIAAHQARTGESLASSPGDTVRMAMEQEPPTAHGDDSVVEAAARMAADRISCLPILETGDLVGLVTTTDILAAEVRRATTPASGPSVSELMSHKPETVHPDDLLLDAAAKMQVNRIRHLPVVDGDNHVLGMLSDRDVRTAVGNPATALDSDSVRLNELRVRNVMSSPALTATPTQSCREIAHVFITQSTSAMPVVDQNERLMGIVSYIDLLRTL